ncbi:hypothetical protein ABT167_28750 [Streptomyces sp. NPDC001792]|uniref:hypothetical protein n=1 Tax=Streptomyces sp. NPDC001792 TaxID=3154524 RepID=UPI003329252D
MISITAEEIEQVEAQAAAAERERVALEQELKAKPFSEVTGQKLTEASMQAAQLAARAKLMRAQREREVAAHKESREELERLAEPQIAKADRELRKSEAKLAKATAAAQEALVSLMEAAAEHSAVVEQHADALAAARLSVDGGRNGGGWQLGNAAVRVRGRLYESVAPAAVLLWVSSRVASARLPYPSPVQGGLEALAGYGAWERRADGLLSDVSAPERVVFPEPPRLKSALQG